VTGKIISVEEGVKGKVRLESGDEFENPEAGKRTCSCKTWKWRTCGPQPLSPEFQAYLRNLAPRVKYLTETKNHILGRSEKDRAAQALKADFGAIAACERQNLKECTPCKDNDEGVKAASNKPDLSCVAVADMCNNAKIGAMVRLHCPKTCGVCDEGLQQDVELDDVVAGEMSMRHAWAPTSPTVNPTEPPVADGGPTDAGEVCAF